MSTAVVLLSGGLDSATVLAIAHRDGHQVHALTFDYGQRHRVELQAAAIVARTLGAVRHSTVQVDLSAVGGSALTDKTIAVPKARSLAEMETSIPITYVPARNTLFLAYALGYAEVVEATDIYLGVNALDYSGYPDCRPEFIEAFERMANLATRAGVEGDGFRFHAPLMHLDKAAIIRLGTQLGVDYAVTHSCYDPTDDGAACGDCDSCLLRQKGFAEANIPDPTRYA